MLLKRWYQKNSTKNSASVCGHWLAHPSWITAFYFELYLIVQKKIRKSSVADPHIIDVDHFDTDTDPDPSFHFDADLDLDPTFYFYIRVCAQIWIKGACLSVYIKVYNLKIHWESEAFYIYKQE